MITACPNCGTRETVIKAYALGTAEKHFDVTGENVEDVVVNLRLKHRGVVRCAHCLQKRRDLEFVTTSITVRPVEVS